MALRKFEEFMIAASADPALCREFMASQGCSVPALDPATRAAVLSGDCSRIHWALLDRAGAATDALPIRETPPASFASRALGTTSAAVRPEPPTPS